MKAFFLVAVLSAPPAEQDLMIAELYETDPVLAVEVLDVIDELADLEAESIVGGTMCILDGEDQKENFSVSDPHFVSVPRDNGIAIPNLLE